MSGYQFQVRCAGCGNELAHTADGVVTTRHTCALAECVECRALWRVDVRMACVREPQPRLRAFDNSPVAWDETAAGAGLIRLIMATEDELAEAAVACGSGSANGADSVAQEAGNG
jgi:hypothetical protein